MLRKSSVAALFLLVAAGVPSLAAAQMPNPYGAPIATEAAKRAAAGALAEARKNGWTVFAAVVDTGGTLVYLERIDGAQNGSSETAIGKARTAAAFKRPSKALEDAIGSGKVNYLRLPGATPLEGGLPLVVDGKIVGAIGVSGATSAQDGQCAKAGADALGAPAAAAAPAAPAAPAGHTAPAGHPPTAPAAPAPAK
jgi:uncharacterized protein GlcG (DUF336 family)